MSTLPVLAGSRTITRSPFYIEIAFTEPLQGTTRPLDLHPPRMLR